VRWTAAPTPKIKLFQLKLNATIIAATMLRRAGGVTSPNGRVIDRLHQSNRQALKKPITIHTTIGGVMTE
jgi:hypothetical protein